MWRLLLPFLFAVKVLHATPSPEKLKALYGSLDQRSVSQHLALYLLYPESPEGQRALKDGLKLLTTQGARSVKQPMPIFLPQKAIEAIVSLVNKQPLQNLPLLTSSELSLISELAKQLPNRTLAGSRARHEADVMALPPEQIDLARALFLSELGDKPEAMQQIQTYEAMIDLMALQLLARVNLQEAPQKKIRELNRFVFETMNFRFPPKSQFEKDIHLYTFLPSVLDSRRGVCLGVSILYTCLAQRLGLPLQLVTPPGHIFVRYRDDQGEINIETTLRGVHIDSDEYLGIDTKQLEQRNIKETVGLAHINEASVYFQQGHYQEALEAYLKAQRYLPQDAQLQELMGYTYFLLGDDVKAKELLEPIRDYVSPYTVGKNTLLEDVLTGRADGPCLTALFCSRENTATALKEKQEEIEKILKNHPEFRAGWLHLGTTLLSLGRSGEALKAFQSYHDLDRHQANVEFTLAVLYAQRMHYLKAWDHLHRAEEILLEENHQPECLKEFRKQLALRCPE